MTRMLRGTAGLPLRSNLVCSALSRQVQIVTHLSVAPISTAAQLAVIITTILNDGVDHVFFQVPGTRPLRGKVICATLQPTALFGKFGIGRPRASNCQSETLHCSCYNLTALVKHTINHTGAVPYEIDNTEF